jgi:uncharacterized protein
VRAGSGKKGAVCLADGVRRPDAHWDGADHRLGRPGSARPGVSREHDGTLVVRVRKRAVDGHATVAALASTFGVGRSAVTLVAGASSRTKSVDVAGAEPAQLDRLLQW